VNDFRNNVFGIFGQYTWHIKEETLLEAGLRYDHHAQYGNFLLPRISLFHRFNDAWATRWGLGWGYKTPNPLAPQNVEYSIDKIQPMGSSVVPEHSLGANAEVNWRKNWGADSKVFINMAFFLTNLSKPIIAAEDNSGYVNFANQDKPVVSAGADMYVSATLKEWELYFGYTYTDARRHYLPGNPFVVLTPQNRLAFVIGRNIGENWLLGLEGSYNGGQYRDSDTKTPGYMFLAAMIRRKLGEHVTLVLNGENLLNYRQSDHEPLFTGTITNPVFKPLWAPIDGRVVNFSLRLNL
jgi:iron complex outermembrane receptor protein/outer membrane receptor for ferrienterochelin and colicins